MSKEKRRFVNWDGEICVQERSWLCEEGSCELDSAWEGKKSTRCVRNNEDVAGTTPEDCPYAEICIDE